MAFKCSILVSESLRITKMFYLASVRETIIKIEINTLLTLKFVQN